MTRLDRIVVTAALGMIAVGAFSCGDDDIAGLSSDEGLVTVSLAGPGHNDGAVLVTISGPGFLDARAANSSYRVYWRLTSATELRVIVLGSVSDGPLFTVRVPDPARVSRYRGTVLQVADRYNAMRESVSDYDVTITAAQGG